jgi:exodeoxyribonuclease V beta subunit
MQPLNFMQLPLQGTSLIEASAGTGKTYTIAALYLRLVLGHGVATPLRPDEILVVTFTEAATAELKGRIQQRLSSAALVFAGEQPAEDAALQALLAAFAPEQHAAYARQLDLAAQWMDEAAVATIHGWAKRMLSEHAFACGSQFEHDLVTDQSSLQLQVVMDYWRSEIYPLPLPLFVRYQQSFASPEQLWQALLPLWQEALSAPTQSLAELLEQEIHGRREQLAALKAPWRHWVPELGALIEQGRAAGLTNNTKLRADYVAKWLKGLSDWCEDEALVWPDIGKGLERLTPDGMAEAWKGPAPQHPAFDAMVALSQALTGLPDVSFMLRLHALAQVRQQFELLKQQRAELGFDDLLSQLDAALQGDNGDALADIIRRQFPLALIDEFQDTDPLQWRIFSRIYQPEAQRDDSGLLLIGDPKQAIYGFRGADIYTYLAAKQQTRGRHFSLGTNFRSSQAMVEAVNQLFLQAEQRDSGQGAFLFRDQPELLPFIPVQAKGRTEQLVLDAEPLPALQWLQLDRSEKPLSKAAYLSQSARQCAWQIVSLLNAARQQRCGFLTPDGVLTPLQPADIAVLVNNQQEADAIRAELAALDVRAVYLSDKGSVFDSALAGELYLWLSSCAEPRHVGKLRAALATPAMGWTYAQLLALQQDDWALEQMQLRFIGYQQVWRSQGVLALVHRLLQDFALVQQLARRPDAERQLTDLFHLAELLQQAARQLDGEAALLRYLQHHLQGDGELGADALKLRLESDEALLKIVTIHKSKGLEYPLVFLPFLLAARELDAKKLPYSWHQADGARQLARRFDEQSFARAEQERLGEDLRKLYVALTRARYGCIVTLAALKERSALGYLLCADGVLAPQTQWLPAVFTAGPAFGLATLQSEPPARFLAEPLPVKCSAQSTGADGFELQGIAPRASWQISSYSALKAPSQHTGPQQASSPQASPLALSSPDDSASAGKIAELLSVVAARPDVSTAADQNSFAQQFVRGAGPGTFLHAQLEWAALQGFAKVAAEPALLNAQLQTAAAQAGLIRRHSDGRWQRLMLQSDKEQPVLCADASLAVADLADWLLALLRQPLPVKAGASLAAMPACIAELEFLLPAARVDIRLLDALVQQQFWPGVARPELQPRLLNGMLKGFIDLTLFDGERYYVADFKSNYREDGCYGAAELQQMMLEARYDLQAALYGLALHRLLSARLKDYQPERHIGPALYWFLRGSAATQSGQGVLAVPCSAACIRALDALFRGDTTPARALLQSAEFDAGLPAGFYAGEGAA